MPMPMNDLLLPLGPPLDRHGLALVFAAESGSRAWDFASPLSG
jgi:hypothetical protein